jgi:hypothetical protein
VAAGVVAARGRVAVAVPKVRVFVSVGGRDEGIVAASSVILAWAVWAAAVRTACGSGVGVASSCAPRPQEESVIEVTSRRVHRIFFKRTISPPGGFSPPSIPGKKETSNLGTFKKIHQYKFDT